MKGNNKMKCIVSSLIVIALLLNVLFVPMPIAKADVNILYSGICGDVAWSIDDAGNLHISGSGEMLDYPYVDEDGTQHSQPDWNKYNYTSITIDEGVTEITAYAFENNSGISKVVIPESVKSINNCAFYNCTNLTEVYFEGYKCDIANNDDTFSNYITTVQSAFFGTFYCHKDSDAYNFAIAHGIEYQIPENECQHKQTFVENEKKSTCTEKGYSGDVYCKECKILVCKGTIIEPTAHSFGQWNVVKAATVWEEGLEERICKVCGKRESNVIEKLAPIEESTSDSETTLKEEITIEYLDYPGEQAHVKYNDVNMLLSQWDSYFGANEGWYEGAQGTLLSQTNESWNVKIDSIGWGGIWGAWVYQTEKINIEAEKKYSIKCWMKSSDVDKWVFIAIKSGEDYAFGKWVKLPRGIWVNIDKTFIAEKNADSIYCGIGGDFGDRSGFDSDAEIRYALLGSDYKKKLADDGSGDPTAPTEIICNNMVLALSSDIEQIDGTHEVIKALAKPYISGKISQNGNFEVSW